ncbi:MAG TPA: hypothetical protein PKN80_08020 [bacterium]|nr:hypothetical protein [bacterium]
MPEAKSPGQNWLKNPFLPAAAIILLGLLVYAGTFNAAFHFDDMYHLVENPALQGFRRLPELLRYWPTRALAFFTFALNRQLHGLWLPGYHLVNLLLHLAAALLVRQLALLALAAPRLAGTPAARHRAAVGLFAGLIFVSHPVQTQAVTYIYQRSTLLAAALYLLALVLYLRCAWTRPAAAPAPVTWAPWPPGCWPCSARRSPSPCPWPCSWPSSASSRPAGAACPGGGWHPSWPCWWWSRSPSGWAGRPPSRTSTGSPPAPPRWPGAITSTPRPASCSPTCACWYCR